MATSQCCANPPTLDPVYGKGMVVDNFGGLKTYISGALDFPKPAVLLVSDVFDGSKAWIQNVQKYPLFYLVCTSPLYFTWLVVSLIYVVVPDFLYGDPMPPNDFSQFPTWIQKHGPAKGFEDAKLVIQALKRKGVSAIGAVGFCWGAKVVVELAKSDDIKAAVLLHPSFVTVDDIKEVKVPVSILGAEIDLTTPPEVTKQFEEILSTKPEVPSYVKIFAGVQHGWTVRYEVTDKASVEKAEEAHKDLLNWLNKYVK
ncbi:endo-1,3;1,4-beta-D-glucanase-like isoform X1 [Carex rostrata]